MTELVERALKRLKPILTPELGTSYFAGRVSFGYWAYNGNLHTLAEVTRPSRRGFERREDSPLFLRRDGLG